MRNEVSQAGDATVSLTFEGGGPLAFMVSGHDSRLGQVFDNLIENARSFSPPGGQVRVTCRRQRNEVEIIVDDDGPGIRPDAFEKIFERFYTDRPHQGFGQNSGLGLSISKQIIEAHGGRIWAENRTGVAAAHRRSAESSRRALRGAFAGDVMATPTIHASAVLVGARAVLIRGPSGSGKSSLALALLQAADHGALPFARLVGDDRVHVEAAHGRLLVRPAATLAGQIEVRGLGIRRMAHEPVAVVGLVVELGRGRLSGCRSRRSKRPLIAGIAAAAACGRSRGRPPAPPVGLYPHSTGDPLKRRRGTPERPRAKPKSLPIWGQTAATGQPQVWLMLLQCSIAQKPFQAP